ncbi:MAG: glycosyltransferase family 2 protein [Bacteroidota bacterium]
MLSIIIVNYNVQYFIEHCLYSVQKAIAGMYAEVIVVDNNSADESVAYLTQKFPWIILKANTENIGYAKACNQGLQIAKGDYILFLNPDTILSEDCLERSIEILTAKRDIGALGIHMIDGTGRFLPESKRGFPSPRASFFKLSGLIKILTQSRMVTQYYLGWLPEKANNEIDVLSGAYMMIKKEVLEKTGGFDEQFFMYGEDIDLSYRIRQAGYKNYYLGEKSIIHFKGESTNKNSRYTKLFYKAMKIFVAKHYKKKSTGFMMLMRAGIGISHGLSFAGQLFMPKHSTVLTNRQISTIICGGDQETRKAANILMSYPQVKRKIVFTADLTGMRNAAKSQPVDEIVFCGGLLPYKDIINYIENSASNIDYKFFAADGNSIVGSASKNSSGEVLMLGGNS